MDEQRPPIRILLAGQHALLRQAIKSALDHEVGIDVVAESQSGAEAAADAERLSPDVAVVEVDAASSVGVRAVALLRERAPRVRVLLLADGEDLDVLIAGLEAGGQGYVSKESPLADLVGAARAVMRDELVIPPKMLNDLIVSLMHRRKERNEGIVRVAKLTHREREVLRLLSRGADNAAIGRALVISPQTARTHIQNILHKLGAHSRLEAVAFARSSGIFDDSPDALEEERDAISLTG
jgi:DNA-binding NarL/FixJ family response regulator